MFHFTEIHVSQIWKTKSVSFSFIQFPVFRLIEISMLPWPTYIFRHPYICSIWARCLRPIWFSSDVACFIFENTGVSNWGHHNPYPYLLEMIRALARKPPTMRFNGGFHTSVFVFHLLAILPSYKLEPDAGGDTICRLLVLFPPFAWSRPKKQWR